MMRNCVSYKFETPDDTGTGSNFKGMVAYDLAVLLCTDSPSLGARFSLAKLTNDEKVTADVLVKICNELKCNIPDVMDLPLMRNRKKGIECQD